MPTDTAHREEFDYFKIAGRLSLVAILVFATAWLGIEITIQFGRVAAIWAANAILLAVLLRSSSASWSGYLMVGYAANILADLATGDPIPRALGLSACNSMEVIIAAYGVRRLWGPLPDLTKIRTLIGFVCAAGAVAPAIAGVFAALVLRVLEGVDGVTIWRSWFVADGLGMVLITPLLLTVKAREIAAMLRPAALLHTVAVLGCVALVVGIVFYQNRYPILFMIFPPLLLAAFRLRFEGAAVAIFLTAAIAIGMTSLGHGPLMLIARSTMVDYILLLQLILATACVTILPVAAILGERRRLEEQARKAHERAEEANRAKSEFLAGLSHELRTPLNAIIGFSDLIDGQKLGPVGNPKYQEYARDIRNSGVHLLAMINELLDFSKIESGHLELHEETVELDAVLDFAIRMVQPRAQKNGVTLQVEADRKVDAIMADERRLVQIMLNILTNAIKFTQPGGRVVIRDGVSPAGEIMLSVEDTGIGISPEDQARVLEPFRQGQTSLSRGQEGTGLGLTITKRLVEMHGGTLVIESQIAVGTKVTIRFPARRLVELRQRQPRPEVIAATGAPVAMRS